MLARMLIVWLGTASLVFAAEPAKRPNVILILADDLGCYELGCYGQKKIRTPHIDALASDGLKFQRFYSGNAVCAPSRCCLMTGFHPGHATIRNNQEVKPEGQSPINATDITIATRFKQQGYATGAIGKWGLGMFGSSGDPLRQGFDSFFGYNCQRHAHSHYPSYLYRNAERFDLLGNSLKTGDTHSHTLFEKETLSFIDTHKDKPFFLYLPYTIPHVAVQATDAATAPYRGALGDDPPYDGAKGYQPHPTPHAAYAGMVSMLDATVGAIRAKLKTHGLDRNTLILFTSDNGPTHNVGGADSTFFESAGSLRGLKGSLYEGGLRVPMIATWPGTIAPNTTTDAAYAFYDVPATLAAVAGFGGPIGDGVDFSPIFHNQPAKPREFFYWEFPGYGGQQAVIAGDWKAIRQQLNKGIKTELYNLKNDPAEANNLAAAHPDEVRRLEAIMAREHVRSAIAPLPSIDPKK
jgi:arylsulfatase A